MARLLGLGIAVANRRMCMTNLCHDRLDRLSQDGDWGPLRIRPLLTLDKSWRASALAMNMAAHSLSYSLTRRRRAKCSRQCGLTSLATSLAGFHIQSRSWSQRHTVHPHRLVLMGDRRPKQGHNAIAHDLVHCPLIEVAPRPSCPPASGPAAALRLRGLRPLGVPWSL
jgi:hypothetical protein